MRNILLSSLLGQDIFVHQELVDWKDFYQNHLLSYLDYDQIYAEYLRAKTINTAIIRSKNRYEFTHNLILDTVINDIAYQSMIQANETLKTIDIKNVAEFDFLSTLIVETLDIIGRNEKAFDDLNEPYEKLCELIKKDNWQSIYPNAKFTKTCFYKFINVNMRTAQDRHKKLEKKYASR